VVPISWHWDDASARVFRTGTKTLGLAGKFAKKMEVSMRTNVNKAFSIAMFDSWRLKKNKNMGIPFRETIKKKAGCSTSMMTYKHQLTVHPHSIPPKIEK
jgi:hypothetical protein